MQITHLPTVTVNDTAGGTFILTAAEARAGTDNGMVYVTVNPSVDIALVDPLGTAAAVPGTFANSPWVCPAGTPTLIAHRSGALKAIANTGTSATVKRSLGGEP